ncbi:MAG TPA: ABC transporter ATP-binding protein [bacterium]|nr:ABC transporter ATP-binding protein [bacterium]
MPAQVQVHVAVEGLVKRFGVRAAVEDVSFRITRGECLVLLGPSGCGKTTTLRCVAGFETPDRGRIVIGGRTVFDHGRGRSVPPARRDIGMVFQSYAVWPHMTVFDNVAFPLRIRRRPRREIMQRVGDVLALVGLRGHEGHNASALSGGQMQRVALARSLVYGPSLLLLDEPLSNLDAVLRERLRVEIKAILQQTNTTAIYVTHDQIEAAVLGDEIAVMNAGVIEQQGSPTEIFSRPAHPFVADFLGATNRVAGVAQSVNGQWTVRTERGDVLTALPPAAPIAPGSRCVVVFRPESLQLSAVRPAAAVNLWDGDVVEVRYLGTSTLYTVRSALGDLLARPRESRVSFQAGRHVWLHVPADSAVVLRDIAPQGASE